MRSFVPALVLGAALASAGGAPATAAPCVGERSLFYVCVTTPTVDPGSKEYCVYAGTSDCIPVEGPDPTVTGDFGYTCTTSIVFTASELPHTACDLIPL